MGPNDLVVCVDAACRGEPYAGRMDGLVKGRIYTIRKAGPHFDGITHFDGVWLREIHRPLAEGWEEFGEQAYGADRFRPVNPNRIQVFRSLLVNPRKRIEVEA